MSQTRLEQVEAVELALAAYRVGGEWRLDELADTALASVESIVAALRRFPSDVGAMALLTVDEDFFVLVRVEPHQVRVLLSDVTAAEEWQLAESVLEFLGLPVPDAFDEEADELYGPAGDLTLLADLGMHPVDMGVLLEDVELYPDEMLSDIATRLGFGPAFDEAAGLEAL